MASFKNEVFLGFQISKHKNPTYFFLHNGLLLLFYRSKDKSKPNYDELLTPLDTEQGPPKSSCIC